MKNKIQILKNEFGIYYVVDENGYIQYHNDKILACANKEILEKYLRTYNIN